MSQGKRRHSRADSDRPQQRRDRRFDPAGLTFLLVLMIGGDRLRRERVKQTQLGWMSSKTGIWDDELSKSFWERMIRPLLTMIVSVFKKRRARKNRSKKQQQNTRLDQDLRQAGISLTAGEFVIVRLMLTAMITFSSAIMARNVTRDLSLQLLILLFALTIAVTLPVLYLRSRVRGRQLAIQNQMPYVTELQTFVTAIVQSEQYGTPMKTSCASKLSSCAQHVARPPRKKA